ncbi:MAG: hypothetical protein K1X81_01750 [Bacteroidia bacterium]|nr:hypothetical protein [Bacteroidia bacterium]
METRKQDQEILDELRKLREPDREIRFEEMDGSVRIVTYNEHLKETIVRDTEGKESVEYESITEEELERLNDWAKKIEYYTDLNDSTKEDERKRDM